MGIKRVKRRKEFDVGESELLAVVWQERQRSIELEKGKNKSKFNKKKKVRR